MWSEANNKISKEFSFEDFISALLFVNKVGALAEKANHHPDIELSWGKVIITLSTHSKNKVTAKDLQLAKEIDKL